MFTTVTVIVVILAVLVVLVLVSRKKPQLPTGRESSARELPPSPPPTPQHKDHELQRRSAVTRPDPKRGAERKDGDGSGSTYSFTGGVDDNVAPAGREPAVTTPTTVERPAETVATPPPRPDSRATSDDKAAIKEGLKGTRTGFIARLANVFRRKPQIDPALLEELEEVLITADLGVPTTQKILGALKARLDRSELDNADAVWTALREEGAAILGAAPSGLVLPSSKPAVILVVGVNGVGKTTTIGKLAARYAERGQKVLIVAGDTYRAAAVMQLEAWSRRAKCEVAKGGDRADPSAVIFDAIKRGVDEAFDLVICDTAGRLHTKTPLMEEIKKVGRSVEKALGRPADEVLLVLDATTGQNALQQANQFKDALSVSGVVLTKLDGTAKGGVVLGIVDQQNIPVRFVGVGERMEDLRVFDAESFLESLFSKPEPSELAASEASGDAL